MNAGVRRADPQEVRRIALEVLAGELQGLDSLRPLLAGEAFFRAVELLLQCRGRIVLSGVGKSGLAAQRIAASLRSTGTPAIFIHPVEAVHGDLGIVEPGDVAVLISKSGASGELCALQPTLRQLGVPVIAVTAGRGSELARAAEVVLLLEDVREVPLPPEIPTVSTTVVQVIGDALTVILYQLKGLTAEEFAFFHPGGVLGRRATLRVDDVMHRGADLPCVREGVPLVEAIVEIMQKRLGMTTVVNADGRLTGVLTDGDFKRILHQHGGSIQSLRTVDVMSPHPRTIERDARLMTALQVMETNQPGAITSLIVVDAAGRPEGVVHIHDCLRMPSERGR